MTADLIMRVNVITTTTGQGQGQGHEPTRGSGEEGSKMCRVESGRVRRCSKCHRPGRAKAIWTSRMAVPSRLVPFPWRELLETKRNRQNPETKDEPVAFRFREQAQKKTDSLFVFRALYVIAVPVAPSGLDHSVGTAQQAGYGVQAGQQSKPTKCISRKVLSSPQLNRAH